MSLSPSLITLSKSEGGENIAKALLTKAIEDVINFINVGQCMNDKQVMSTVNLILESYGQYKIDDWILCFKNAKKGYYGTVYNRIDGQVIFSWFDQYILDRNADIESLRQNQKRQLEKKAVQEEKAVPMPDYIKELLVKKKVEDTPVITLSQTDQQKRINEWMYDFDKLWETQGREGGKRFVTIDGKRLDISEYLEYKNKQYEAPPGN